jgi:hypothetical protein
MSCYAPDLRFNSDIFIDLLDENGKYIIKNCPYGWPNSFNCKDMNGNNFN